MRVPETMTGLVISFDKTNSVSVTGTCAAYKFRHVFLTASHCVPSGCSGPIFVVMPSDGEKRQVTRIERHSAADIAVLFSEPKAKEILADHIYDEVWPTIEYAADFIAFGYPSEVQGRSTEHKPIGRIFKGHVQRYFGYEPAGGRDSYFAAELSIPAPQGLSGGPVSLERAPQKLIGIVTANMSSYVIEDSHEEVQDGEKYYRSEVRRIVSYGIAACLINKIDWLDSLISTHSSL